MSDPVQGDRRLVSVTLDEDTIGRRSREVEHERAIAIHDLLEANSFELIGYERGPYALRLAIADGKLVFDVRRADGGPLIMHILTLTPFRRLIKDYFLICESYYAAIQNGSPAQVEAIDMGRRGLHNEAAELLRQRLSGKIGLDLDTARRLFTLISVLYWKGDGSGG